MGKTNAKVITGSNAQIVLKGEVIGTVKSIEASVSSDKNKK